jgi:SprT protein
MKREDIHNILAKYLPDAAVEPCADLLIKYKVKLKITRSRASRYGDYTSPTKHEGHVITINHNLNKYFFLLTLIHELAHLLCHEKYYGRTPPHGPQWKNEFIRLLDPASERKFFPADLIHAISSYMSNPAATSCSDINLMRALKKYDEGERKNLYHLEDLPEQAIFHLADEKKGRRYCKGEKMRKRFRCLELHTGYTYFISPVAEVELLEMPKPTPKKAVQLTAF